MENNGGPSPLVPFLMLGVLGLVLYGQMFIVLLPLLLLLLANLVSPSCTSFGRSAQDPEGYGLGALLLLVLYLVGIGYASSGHCRAQDAEGYWLKALLLLVLYVVGVGCFTNQQHSSGSRADAGGYGVGTLLVVAVFYVLVLGNIW
ncbi:hypothetical protein MANES_09G133800v8 [Manihot esculenta]|uniref:Uncharacterized protein n=1 Tax=Manihot esculenta TaxID=3983 RepID=A0A2C9VC70_MANES|nr:hypothetical protein MANES_09G133800v8 [Manihot esculenta]